MVMEVVYWNQMTAHHTQVLQPKFVHHSKEIQDLMFVGGYLDLNVSKENVLKIQLRLRILHAINSLQVV